MLLQEHSGNVARNLGNESKQFITSLQEMMAVHLNLQGRLWKTTVDYRKDPTEDFYLCLGF